MQLFSMVKYYIIIIAILLSNALSVNAQDDLEKLLEDEAPQKEIVKGAFKSTRVINLQSLEKVAPGTLQFVIQHRFGPVNGGYYQLFGLDQATIRYGFEYGLNRFVTVGMGRSGYQKNVDGFIKTSLIRQSKGGEGALPFSLLYFGSVSMNGMKWIDTSRTNYFTSRLSYVNQLILGSKISDKLSLQIVPTAIHRNLVTQAIERNTVFAIGTGGRFKITKRMSINAEYILRIPPKDKTILSYANNYNSFSIGVDIETGGHVFQLHCSNSLPMFDKGFMVETDQSWAKGGIHFGFNITRDFVINKNAKK